MGLFTGFEKGTGGRYVWDTSEKNLVKVSEQVNTPNAGLNGPVWFPKGGHKYFDKALQREFHSLDEKKNYMREHKLIMQGMDREGDRNCPEAGLGKRYYSFGGQKIKSKGVNK